MTEKELKEIAFKSLRESYSETQVFNLSFDGNVTKITEYFITVNLCKELYKWNQNNHYQYIIEAEKCTSKFYENCFECFKYEEKDNIFSPTIFSKNDDAYERNYSPIRKGKIDIALSKMTNGFTNIAEYIIEVKSINPNLTKLKEDFKRIQHYLNAKIPKFKNSLKSGYIVFIRHINNSRKVQSAEDLSQEKEIYLNNLKENLSSIGSDNINFDINVESIEYSPYENLKLHDENCDFGEIAHNTYTAFSVIIEIKKCDQPVSQIHNF